MVIHLLQQIAKEKKKVRLIGIDTSGNSQT